MKTKSLVSIIALSLLAGACGSREAGKVRSFIPGTYTRTGESPFNSFTETLTIVPKPGASDVYSVSDKIHLVYKEIDGAVPAPRDNNEDWDGVFHPDTRTLDGPEPGSTLSFDPVKKVLYYKDDVFKKQ